MPENNEAGQAGSQGVRRWREEAVGGSHQREEEEEDLEEREWGERD